MNDRRNMHLKASPRIFDYAFHLRRNPTKAEKILWEYLKDRQIEGIRFRQQHPVKKYVADFYAHEVKLIIELDGKQHQDPTQLFYDTDRTEILKSYKVSILRFSNEEVFKNVHAVVEAIRKEIIRLKSLK